MMRDPQYSTKTAFDWILSHYFLNGLHYAWICPEFFPYRLRNPYTSNPLKIYEGFYAAWKDGDEFSPWVAQKRLGLRKSIEHLLREGKLESPEADELKELIDSASVNLFYPLVYRLDLEALDGSRRNTSGSGLIGSSEYLIVDLAEHEFELLFAHFREDDVLRRLVLDSSNGLAYFDSYEVAEIIESRKISK